MKMLVSCLLCVAGGSAFGSQYIVNPSGAGQFTDLQTAIGVATSNDVIVVEGGCYRGVVIDKPLTIVGSGTIRRKTVSCSHPFHGSGLDDGCFGVACPALDVTTSSGIVTLAGFAIEGQWDASFAHSNAEATIRVAGATQLRIYDCTVTGPIGFSATGTAITTTAAIEAPGSVVTIARSQITGGEHVLDGTLMNSTYWLNLVAVDGPPAIVAHHVNVLEDSSVIGGTQGDYQLLPGDWACPPPWPSGVNPNFGKGGPAIVADTVYSLGFVAGGNGSQIVDNCLGAGVIHNRQPAGPDVIATSYYPLSIGLVASGPMTLGDSWSLLGVGSGGYIVIGVPSSLPSPAGAPGLLWVVPPFLPFIQGNAWSTTVPNDPALLGVQIGAQWMSGSNILSPPVFQVIEP